MTTTASSARTIDAAVRVFMLLTLADAYTRQGASAYALDAVEAASWEQPLATVVMACAAASSLRRLQ